MSIKLFSFLIPPKYMLVLLLKLSDTLVGLALALEQLHKIITNSFKCLFFSRSILSADSTFCLECFTQISRVLISKAEIFSPIRTMESVQHVDKVSFLTFVFILIKEATKICR